MNIARVTEITDEVVEAFSRLVPQLTRTHPAPSREELASIAASPATILLVARETSRVPAILGTVTLLIYRTPACLRARVEDLVVDQQVRGQGIGRALLEAALTEAARAEAEYVELQTSPDYEIPNRLYRSAGFELRHRNLYHRAPVLLSS